MGHEFGSYGEIGWVGPPAGWFGGAHARVSLRTGGVSRAPFESLNLGRMSGDDPLRVEENERRWLAATRATDAVARARLVHGTHCVVADSSGLFDACDGLLTRRAGLPLWITVADCVPLFLEAGPWIGLLHCGWRGAAAGGAGVLVAALAAAASIRAGQQRAWIGPGVGPCCYPVGEEVGEKFSREVLRMERDGIRLDLAAAIRRDLLRSGLPESSISGCNLCTSCRPDLFFSYRRDGARSGRMASVIWRDDQPR